MATWLPTTGEISAIVATNQAVLWANGVERDYVVSAVPEGLLLVHRNSAGERIVWVEVADNTSFPFRGYISSDGRSVESVSEILEMDGLL